MLNRRRPLRLVVIALTALAVVTACERRNQPTAPPPPPPAPVPTPTPLPTPSVAPAPMPTTGSDPVAPQRTQVVSLLDQIEALLVECESNQMQHVEPQTRRIEELVGQMATSVASFPGAAEPYAQLQTQAPRFTEACRHGDHSDMHNHHAHLRRAAAAVRAAL